MLGICPSVTSLLTNFCRIEAWNTSNLVSHNSIHDEQHKHGSRGKQGGGTDSSPELKCDGTRWRMGGKVKGKLANECAASTLHTTSEHGVSSITTADAHTSAASSRLNWRPSWFKWTRPFRRKTKSGFCACAITFQTQSTADEYWSNRLRDAEFRRTKKNSNRWNYLHARNADRISVCLWSAHIMGSGCIYFTTD